MDRLKKIAIMLKNHASHFVLPIVFVLSVLLYRLAYLFRNDFDSIMSVSSYLSWHIVFEFTGIVICFAIFVVFFFTYDRNRNLRTALTGLLFLTIGLLDAMHTLSFRGMPVFFATNDTANRATTFWIISRLAGSIGMLVIAYIPQERKTRMNRWAALGASLIFSLVVFSIATYSPEALPAMYIEEVGLTATKIYTEYLIMFLFAATMLIFIKEYISSGSQLALLLSVAILMSIFSEWAFVSYVNVYDVYNYLGHLYKIIAFTIIFKVMFIFNVQKPYLELSEANSKLDDYAQNLDRLVEIRTQELREINDKLMEDLEYARDIQKALLPAVLPQEEGVSFYARYYPAEKVSGDFYNIFKLDDEHIAMYIGDVAGHGVSAAMMTVFINQSIRAANELDKDRRPSNILKRVYASFNKTNFKDEVYAVLLYAVYNFKTRELTYSSAGLNVCPIVTSCGGKAEELEICGFPIFKFIDYYGGEYENHSMVLEPGQKILFYTDGLVDVRNHSLGYYSVERLKAMLSHMEGQPGSKIAEGIEKDVLDFAQSGSFIDDITFFIMEVR